MPQRFAVLSSSDLLSLLLNHPRRLLYYTDRRIFLAEFDRCVLQYMVMHDAELDVSTPKYTGLSNAWYWGTSMNVLRSHYVKIH